MVTQKHRINCDLGTNNFGKEPMCSCFTKKIYRMDSKSLNAGGEPQAAFVPLGKLMKLSDLNFPNLPSGIAWVFVGSPVDRFAVELEVLTKLQNLLSPSDMDVISRQSAFAIYVGDDPSEFKLVLRLARERKVDPTLKSSRTALRKLLRASRRYGLNEIEPLLADRYAITQNTVMPEIAALLETNPRRKLLLFKSVVKKARFMDLVSGGTQSIQSKVAKIKVAGNLLEACEQSISAMNDTWRKKYLKVAQKLLLEGRTLDDLPKSVSNQIGILQQKIGELRTRFGLGTTVEQNNVPPKLMRSISESRREYLERKSRYRVVQVMDWNDKSAQPTTSTSKVPASSFVTVNCSGVREFVVNKDELSRMSVFQPYLDHPKLLALDEPSRFELALHLIRTEGKLDESEKADDQILKSYRDVARNYGLEWMVHRRLENWLLAHRNGAGGARNAREEVRALRLTRMLNPEKGEALVASALAEAYLERVNSENPSPQKLRRLLEKAETNLRTVIPVLLTSLSVVQVSKEQRAAVDLSVAILKQVLIKQGRPTEAEMLDAAVAYFSKGVQGAAKELSAVTRNVPSGMYA